MGREVPGESPLLSSLLRLELSGQVNLVLTDLFDTAERLSPHKHNVGDSNIIDLLVTFEVLNVLQLDLYDFKTHAAECKARGVKKRPILCPSSLKGSRVFKNTVLQLPKSI